MKKVFSLFMIALMLCTGIVSAEPLSDDEEMFPVAKYVDNYSFSGDNVPTQSWQKLPIFENDMAVFDTSRNTGHPCFNGQSFANVVFTEDEDGKKVLAEKYLVLDTKIKVDKKLKTPLFIWDSYKITYYGDTIQVPGYGSKKMSLGEWHRIIYVMNFENAKLEGTTINQIKPYALYIDGEPQTMTDTTGTFSVQNLRMWMQRLTSGANSNITADTADIVYMDHFRIYVKDRIAVKGSSVKTDDIISRKTDSIEIELSHEPDPLLTDSFVSLKKDNGETVSTSLGLDGKKITITPEDELEYGRNYIVDMQGLPTADGRLEYEEENISFFTENQPLYELGEITADGKISITSNWIENRTAVFAACFYDSEGKLVSANPVSAELLYQVPQEITLAESIPAADKIKIFVFDGDLSLAYTAFEGSITGGAIEGTVNY